MMTEPLGYVFGAHIGNFVSPQIQLSDHILVLQEIAKLLDVLILQALLLDLDHRWSFDPETLDHSAKILNYRGVIRKLYLFDLLGIFLARLKAPCIFVARFKVGLDLFVQNYFMLQRIAKFLVKILLGKLNLLYHRVVQTYDLKQVT